MVALVVKDHRRHGKALTKIPQACKWARNIAFDLAQAGKEPENKSSVQHDVKLHPPPQGMTKINSDGSFDGNYLHGATAAIA